MAAGALHPPLLHLHHANKTMGNVVQKFANNNNSH
jgi:hypothetical protein